MVIMIVIIILVLILNNNDNNSNNSTEHILLITMLTIKILSTINSLKKTIPSRHYLKFLSFKRKKNT